MNKKWITQTVEINIDFKTSIPTTARDEEQANTFILR